MEGDVSDDGEVFLEDADILYEIHVDEEDLPDQDDDDHLDAADEVDDSLFVFRGHSGYPIHTDGLTCLSITPDSKIAITGLKYGSIRMVNINTGKVISSLVAHTDSVECIGLSSWPWAASGGMDSFGISSILLRIAVVNMKKV